MINREIIIKNQTGLHARPAALFAQAAAKFKCNIIIEKEKRSCNAKSIMSILSLGAKKGDKVNIIADGDEEELAINTLVNLIDSLVE